MKKPITFSEFLRKHGRKIATSKLERARLTELAKRRRKPSRRRGAGIVGKASTELNKEIRRRRRRAQAAHSRKTDEIRRRRVLRTVCIDGRPVASYARIRRVFEEFRKEGKQIPPRPRTPGNAQAALASITNRPILYQEKVARLFCNSNTHALDFRRKSPWRATWIIAPSYVALVSRPWTVNSALNALRVELHWGTWDTTVHLFDAIVASGDLSESELGELLRRYWALVVEMYEKDELNFDDDFDIGLVVEWPFTSGVTPYTIAHAFSTENQDAQQTIEDVVDVYEDRGMEDGLSDLVQCLLAVFSEPPDFSRHDFWTAFVLFFYCYLHMNEAAMIAYRRIAATTSWADTVAGDVFEDLDRGSVPAEQTMGRWFCPELRALFASHLIGGMTWDDEVQSFKRVLASGGHDNINGPVESLRAILSQVLDDHDALDGDVQKALVDFMLSLDGKDLLSVWGRLQSKQASLIRVLTDEKACGDCLSTLKDLCDPNSILLEGAGNLSTRRNLATLCRGIVERAVRQIDNATLHNDDDIVMRAWSNSVPDSLMWLARATLVRIRKILDEGWTGADEQDLMSRCSQAIGRIDAGQGSATF